ncbi:MAG: V-type ATP synthase subunit E family protein [candidate division WOR-3 bacterium]
MTLKEFVKGKINKIIEEIEKETFLEIKKIREDLEKEKETIGERMLKEAENFLKIERAKRIAEVKLKALNEVLLSRNTIYERLLDILKEDIERRRKNGTYREFFEKLFLEALTDYGEREGKIICSPQDYEYTRELVEKMGLQFEIQKDESIFAGVIIERKDGKIRVLNTLESRLKKAEPYLMLKLFNQIFKI